MQIVMMASLAYRRYIEHLKTVAKSFCEYRK